jgi:hypothetical protein
MPAEQMDIHDLAIVRLYTSQCGDGTRNPITPVADESDIWSPINLEF